MWKINKIKDLLPEEDKYVLIYCGSRPWRDKDSSVYWKVARIVKGMSLEERETLSKSDNPEDIKRSRCYSFGDEEGNNAKSYAFKEFGASSYFGQEIKYWCELPNINDFIGVEKDE